MLAKGVLGSHWLLLLKICAMPDNPAYLAMNKFDRSTKQLYKVRPNGRGGMIRPPTAPVGLRMKAAMKEADIDTSKISLLDIPDLPPGTHAFDPESDNLIEGVTKVEISSSHAKAKFQEYQDEQGNHDEVYTDGSKINEKVGAAAVIKRLFQDGKTTRNLSKRLPDGSSIFSAEATAIILALDYYNAMPAVRHDVVNYSDLLSCLQAILGEDTEHPLLCRIMNLLWKLNDKGTHVKFCWIPSHCEIEGNEAADKLAKESLGLNIDALLGIYHADLKPQVNAYVQQLTQVKWDVEVHGRDLYLLKANLAPPDRYKHLKRAEEVAMTRLRIGHCKATKGHIVSRGPPAVCHHCGSTLSREHILLECGTVQELRGEFYEADSLTSLFECVRPLAIIEYLKEAGFFYLIWQVYESEKRNVKSHKPQNPDYHITEEDKWIAENIQKCVGRLICPEGYVSSLNKLHSIHLIERSTLDHVVFWQTNYANPVYGVVTVCHQVRCLRWGHPSPFHTATSRLIWYKMFCVNDISNRLTWMEFINMFSVYAQSGMHRRFNRWIIAVLTYNPSVLMCVEITDAPKL